MQAHSFGAKTLKPMIIQKLSRNEVKIVNAVARGNKTITYPRVAARFGIDENSVKKYMYRAMEKTGTFSKQELVMAWRCPLFQIGLKELGIL